MTEEKEEKKLLQWHAAFLADIQIELAEEAQYLELQKRLSDEENFWLKNLTNDLKEKQKAERLLVEYKKHESDLLYRSVMNIIVRANRERLEVNDMCKALDELLEFHFKRKLQTGREEGRAEGRLELILSLVKDKLLSLEEAAKRVDMTVEDLRALLVSANGE